MSQSPPATPPSDPRPPTSHSGLPRTPRRIHSGDSARSPNPPKSKIKQLANLSVSERPRPRVPNLERRRGKTGKKMNRMPVTVWEETSFPTRKTNTNTQPRLCRRARLGVGVTLPQDTIGETLLFSLFHKQYISSFWDLKWSHESKKNSLY